MSLFVAKNVAADISDQLCNSVATKLDGKVLGTFSGKPTICTHT
jgi:signal recognition particle receptor subunit alpha